jgi:hypothetical protein
VHTILVGALYSIKYGKSSWLVFTTLHFLRNL